MGGAFVNTWVVGFCCLDMYVVVGASNNPQDLLLDALALLFLYNLDDIGASIAFIDEDDWPALRIAWIYNEVVNPCPDDIFNEDKLDIMGQIFLSLYNITKFSLICLIFIVPTLQIITPFLQ